MFREAVDKQNKKFAKDIKEVSLESAERANQLSRYIDQEIKRVSDGMAKRYDKLKIIFAKFGEQFKNHLINTEAFRKETVEKMKEMEDTFYHMRDEIAQSMQRLETDVDQKLKDERHFLENFVKSVAKVLEDKVNKLKEQLDNDVEILKEAIENNRAIFMNKLQKILDLQEQYHKTYMDNIIKVLGEIEQIKQNLATLREEVERVTLTLTENFNELRTYIEMELLNEKTLRNQQIQDLQDKINDNINGVLSDVNLLRNQVESNERQREHDQKLNEEKFENFANNISDLYNKFNRAQDELIVIILTVLPVSRTLFFLSFVRFLTNG